MYFVAIALFMLVLPVVSIGVETAQAEDPDLLAATGKWFAFWAVGVRLGLAGLRQAFNPASTARAIFEITDPDAHAIVRELGFANLAFGVLGLCALLPGWAAPAALAGGVFFALSGFKHLIARERNAERTVAMVSDLFIAAVLGAYLALTALTA